MYRYMHTHTYSFVHTYTRIIIRTYIHIHIYIYTNQQSLEHIAYVSYIELVVEVLGSFSVI